MPTTCAEHLGCCCLPASFHGEVNYQKGLKCHFWRHSAGRLPGATEPNACSVQASKLNSLGGWATTQNGFAFAQFPLTRSPKELLTQNETVLAKAE